MNDGENVLGSVHTDLNRKIKPTVVTANQNKSGIGSENISDIVHTDPKKIFRPTFDTDDQNTKCVEGGEKALFTLIQIKNSEAYLMQLIENTKV